MNISLTNIATRFTSRLANRGRKNSRTLWTYALAWARKLVSSTWATKLLVLMLIGDITFILLHFAARSSGLDLPSGFYLHRDGGYPEIWQYLKFTGIVFLLASITMRRRSPLYLHWALLFSYLLLDDALRLHERGGLWLAETVGLPALLQLRPRDLGELAVTVTAGLFFLTTLTFTYQLSRRRGREFSQSVLLMLLALVAFGVVADMLQEMARAGWLRAWLAVIEDGGELLVASSILWFIFRQAGKEHGWEERQLGSWVRTAVTGAGPFVFVAVVLATVQFSTVGLAGNDGYYHAKMGFLMRQQGLKPTPPKLPLTVLNESDFYDHHLLYHAYLALFATTDPAVDGGVALTQQAKMATVILPALAFVAIWWLLRQQGIRWAVLWTVALLTMSGAFLYRLSMPRAQAASLLVLVLGLHWLLTRRYRLLLPLGFIYVWLYDAFPLLLVLAGIVFVATAATECRLAWPALAYPAVGILLGLTVNPYFPQNLVFIGHHLLPKLGASTAAVGSEWYPYDSWTLLQNSGVTFGVLLLTVLALNWREKRMDRATLSLFLATAVFGLMLFNARRFIEYFPPFVLILAALSLSPLLEAWQANRPSSRRWLPAAFVLLLALPLITTVKAARTSMIESDPAYRYAAAALWLDIYSEPGSTVFQTDWDDFPRLFFYDDDQTYTVGLDPTYMEQYNAALYAEWVQITRGQVVRPSVAIRERFGADFVFSDLEHEAFRQQAAHDPGLEEIYRDDVAVIFAVVKEAQD